MDKRLYTIGVAAAVVAMTTSAARSPSVTPPVADSLQELPSLHPAAHPGREGAESGHGAALLHAFFGTHWEAGNQAAPDTFDLEIFIATLPDPYDSHLDWVFDGGLEAIRRAFETSGYLTDRFWLPAAKDSGGPARREIEPGVMLFRNRDSHDRRLRLLYVVPELPTRGIYKEAMRAALEERYQLLRHRDLPLRGDTTRPIRIIGPTFSGSALSLQFALRGWLAKHRSDSVTIISGTATNFSNREILNDSLLHISFSATINSDQSLDRVLTNLILPRLHICPREVAILRESSTQYGQGLLGGGVASTTGLTEPTGHTDSTECEGMPAGHIAVIPFPMSISSLRSEYQRVPAGRSAEPALPGAPEAPRLPLDLLDPARPKEDLPVTSRLSPPALDLILDDIARTLTRQQIRLVGLLATDVRDKLFLGDEIRKRVRDVRFFTYESNILYLRSDRYQALGGMLVLSTYPLILENQWLTSDAAAQRFAFGSDGVEGLYNATLAQLGNTRAMLDYRPTSRKSSVHRPPVWVSTVGNGTFLPVTTVPDDSSDTMYVTPGCTHSGPDCATPSENRRHPQLSFLMLAGILLASITLFTMGVRSLRIDRQIRSVFADGTDTRDPEQPLMGRIMEGSLKLHERLYTILRIIAVTGIFLAVCAPALRWMSFDRIGQSGSLVPVLAVVAAAAGVSALLALGSGGRTIAALIGAYGGPGWELFRDGPWPDTTTKWAWRVEVIARGVVALFGVGYLALSVAFAVDVLRLGANDPQSFWPFFRRASEIDSLVSPVLPLVLGGIGYAVWCTWHLERIALLRSHTTFERACEAELNAPPITRITIGSALRDDIRRSARAAQEIRFRLFQVIPSLSALGLLVAFAALGAWLWPQFGWSFEAVVLGKIEGGMPAFDLLFRAMVLATFFAISWGACRLLVVWLALRRCLDSFARMPVVTAFDRLPPRVAQLTRLTLPGRQKPVALGAVADMQWLHLQRIHGVAWEEFAAALGPNETPLVQEIAALMRGPAAQATSLDTAGRKELSTRFNAVHDALRRLWRLEPMAADVTALTKALEKEFEKSDAGIGPTASTTYRIRRGFSGPVRLWVRAAEEYVAARMVEYVEWVTHHMRLLALFMLLSLLLATLVVSSYPYSPQSLLRLILLAVLVGSVGTLVVVLVQMNSDEVLSRIARTEPGKVTWDLPFIMNLLTFGVLPLLTLLSSEFPGLRSILFSWLEPLVKTLVRQ